MSTINDLHTQAMNLADKAFLAQHKNRHDEAIAFSQKSFGLEKKAAMRLRHAYQQERCRSGY